MLCACYLLIFCVLIRFFFFSSRRRNTSCYRDWSSDVCSSDLQAVLDCRHLSACAAGHPGNVRRSAPAPSPEPAHRPLLRQTHPRIEAGPPAAARRDACARLLLPHRGREHVHHRGPLHADRGSPGRFARALSPLVAPLRALEAACKGPCREASTLPTVPAPARRLSNLSGVSQTL